MYGNAGTTISLLYKSDADYAVYLISVVRTRGCADGGCSSNGIPHRRVQQFGCRLNGNIRPCEPASSTTTERYNSKPVYKKAVNTGALSAGTSKSVAHGVQDIGLRLSALYGLNNDGDNLVGNPGITGILVDGSNITITTAAGFSTSNSWVVIAYTKTTD